MKACHDKVHHPALFDPDYPGQDVVIRRVAWLCRVQPGAKRDGNALPFAAVIIGLRPERAGYRKHHHTKHG
jgi:hypothetical protein